MARILRHLRASDLRAVAQLATQATHGVTGVVEGVHQAVLSSLSVPTHDNPQPRTRGMTDRVYRAVHGVTDLVDKGLQSAFARLEPLLGEAAPSAPETFEREAVLAALNGVMGDRLADSGNPLATAMTLRWQGQPLNPPAMPDMPSATAKVLLVIHGLCMNDLQWTPRDQDKAHGQSDHAAALTAEFGYTPVYLRYNTGLHTSQNGRLLATLLEQVLVQWPVPVAELTVVTHSMGGLVMRSAIHCAQADAMQWPRHLKSLVFLGTPHHGAPLEKAGHCVDLTLGASAYTRPWAKLGQLRSSGITDLRYGHVQDSDWAHRNRFSRSKDHRTPLPLPAGVACYTVAASTASRRSRLADRLSDRLVGDGLVPLHSALGQHPAPRHRLHFPVEHQAILYRTNHMALLHSPAVTAQLLRWLRPPLETAGHRP